MLNEFLQTILNWVAANPGWMGLVILLTALGESLVLVGMIVPGAMLMFGFGALIALGHLDFWTACGWAAVGAVAGDGLSFWLGRTFHQSLRQIWPFSRYPQSLARSEAFFRRHGGKSVLLGRFFGPVRALIPAVAGMLDMPVGRFFLVNVISALLWAPAYLLPGMVFAASLELASQVAWRLVVLIIVLIALLGLTVWLVRGLFRVLHPRVHGWLLRFHTWSQEHSLIAPISNSLLDSTRPGIRGLATMTALILGATVLLGLSLGAAGQHLPTALDQSLYHFLQDLRTPWADRLMVFITELGDWPIKLTLTTTVAIWLYVRRARSTAYYWLAAVGLGIISNALLKWVFRVHRPEPAQSIIDSYAFPSQHATLAAILFGFLAVLIARETHSERRWIPYLAAALIAVAIAFSRLYLGLHWFTDAVAGLSLGLLWVTLLGLAYTYHAAPNLSRRGLLLVIILAITVSALPYAGLRYSHDLRRYQPQSTLQSVSLEHWWQQNWQQLPAYRKDFRGQSQQALTLQWAASRQDLIAYLQQQGWLRAAPLSLKSMLMWLNPQVRLDKLPVLPRVHNGRHDDLILTRPGDEPDTRWVLRFWASGTRLQNGPPLWLGSLSLQGMERRMNFLAFAVDLPTTRTPTELLAPALQRLNQRTLAGSNHPVTLIAPK